MLGYRVAPGSVKSAGGAVDFPPCSSPIGWVRPVSARWLTTPACSGVRKGRNMPTTIAAAARSPHADGHAAVSVECVVQRQPGRIAFGVGAREMDGMIAHDDPRSLRGRPIGLMGGNGVEKQTAHGRRRA